MKKTATASRPTARVSLRNSVILFQRIRNKPIKKAKTFLNDLINQKRNIRGKYFTKTSKEILDLIEEAEKNAEAQELEKEKLFIKEAVANKGLRFYLPKSRWTHRGRRAKLCQLNITLEER